MLIEWCVAIHARHYLFYTCRAANFETDLWADSVLGVILQIENSPIAVKRLCACYVLYPVVHWPVVSQSHDHHGESGDNHSQHEHDGPGEAKRSKVIITEVDESAIPNKDAFPALYDQNNHIFGRISRFMHTHRLQKHLETMFGACVVSDAGLEVKSEGKTAQVDTTSFV